MRNAVSQNYQEKCQIDDFSGCSDGEVQEKDIKFGLLHSLLYSSVPSLICYLAEKAARVLEI